MRLILLTAISFVVFSTFAQSPQLRLNKTTITASVEHGSTVTQTFTMTNTGNRDLNWSLSLMGQSVQFSKVAATDFKTAAGHDRVTPNVWLTTGDWQNIFNAASEETAHNSNSPYGTRWSFGRSEDLPAVNYDTWDHTVDNESRNMIGRMLSMYAIDDDRYFDITFHSFEKNADFSYTRRESKVKWMSPDESFGTLIPGQSQLVTVVFDASALPAGPNSGKIVVRSNDPSTEEKGVFVNLNVGTQSTQPVMEARTGKNLGTMFLGSARQSILTINNTGNAPLVISNVVSSAGTILIPEKTSFTIRPEQGFDLPVQFIPSSIGSFTGTLTLSGNDPAKPQHVVTYTVDVIGAPVLSVSATPLTQTVASGSVATLPINIRNNGFSTMSVGLRMKLGTSAGMLFTKSNSADGTLPENQDRISPSLHMARNATKGLYNAVTETEFDDDISPENTLWGAGTYDDDPYFQNWSEYFGNDPWWNINRLYTMVLPDENRIFEVTLKQWTCCENGGGFSYERREVYNWLTADENFVERTSGQSGNVTLSFNAKGLEAGTYNGVIELTSNDPFAAVRSIPVTMIVTGAPVAVAGSSAEFQNTIVGKSSTAKVRVFNNGAAPFTITGVTYSSSHFTSREVNANVVPFGVSVIEVNFTPSAVEDYAGHITITTTDPANPTLTIPYTALGVSNGTIQFTADDMNATVATGSVATRTITIQNNGAGNLTWSAGVVNTNPVVTFTKAAGTNSTLPENQDRISPTVWISHNDRGFVNAYRNEIFDYDLSPVGTFWKRGRTFEVSSSSYDGLYPAIDYDPIAMIDVPYSMKTGNEYYDVVLKSYGYDYDQDNFTGAFSYERQLATGWLSMDVTVGVLAPGESKDITVTLDPQEYLTGVRTEVITINSNDPARPVIEIPVQLTVQGKPQISLSSSVAIFENVPLGSVRTKSVTIYNYGTDVLDISSITSESPAFTVNQTKASIQPNDSLVLTITFTSAGLQTFSGDIVVTSNSEAGADFAASSTDFYIYAEGTGVQSPVINVAPSQIVELTPASPAIIGELSIENKGSVPLNWKVGQPHALSLAEILSNLNENYQSVTSVIPNRYNFLYDGGASFIDDGGGDMYDGGNRLSTNLAATINYSDNVLKDGAFAFGAGTQYFTRHLPGLFVMAADVNGISYFQLDGNNGADGGGSAGAQIFSAKIFGKEYKAFVKKIFSAGDPSINQMIIVENNPSLNHTYATNTDSGLQKLDGMTNTHRVFYLLYSAQYGGYIDENNTRTIFDKFMAAISNAEVTLPNWFQLTEYSGTVAAGATQTVEYSVDLYSHADGVYETTLSIANNDLNKTRVNVPVKINLGSVITKGRIDDVLINEGFGTYEIDFADLFIDGDGDELSYAVGTNVDVLAGSVTDTKLKLTETGRGKTIVSIRAEDTHNNVVFSDFNFRVNDVPDVTTPIEDQTLLAGFSTLQLDASDTFTDTDEIDQITLGVISSNPSAATVTISEDGIVTITEVAVGSSTITVTANDGVGGIATETFTVTINKQTVQIALSNTVAVFDGSAKAVTATTVPANLPVTIEYRQNGALVASPVNAGVYNVTATVNQPNYEGVQTGTLTIDKAHQEITFNAIANVFNSAAPFVLTASSTSGLPVSFRFVSGPVAVSGNTVSMNGAEGMATIEAFQAGNENYNEAVSVRNSFTVEEDPILSTDDPLTASVEVWPIPSKDYVNISTGLLTIKRLVLVDNVGREMFQAEPMDNEYVLEVSSFKQGVYLLKIETNRGVLTKRVQVIN